MIFPKYIKKSDKIGVAATSDSVTMELDIVRFQNAKANLIKLGYEVVLADHVIMEGVNKERVAGKTKGEEFNLLLSDPDVTAIFAAKGGNFLIEMLPYIDFDLLKSNPKWIQGYSDNTSLLFTITTNYDIATIYGNNFGDFGMESWELPVTRNFDILTGREKIQTSFAMYEDGWTERLTGLEGYQCDKEVYWLNGRGEEEIHMSGRLLGGCTDVLFFLAGTKYDGTLKYIQKYKEDGILWFMETFSCIVEELMMHLWKLKEIGWFRHVKGFIFGRPLMVQSWEGFSYEEAVLSILGDLDVPIIFNADIGHKGPQFTMINGAVADITCKDGRGCIKY